MGLDNGFVVKGINKADIPNYIHLPFDEYRDELEPCDICDICYWRKCWGLRREINHFLHLPYEKYECNVDFEDLEGILQILKNYLNPDYWTENHDSIWSWDEYFDYMLQQYMNLSWLQSYWEQHPEITVSWYDSY